MAFFARKLTMRSFRNDPFVCLLQFSVPADQAIDLSGSSLGFAIGYPEDCTSNQYPNTAPREQIVEVTDTTTVGANGVLISDSGVMEFDEFPDEMRPFVELTITLDKATIQGLPVNPEGRADTILTYDLQVDDVTWLYGDFAIKESAGA